MDDETRRWLADLFGRSDPIPRDVVPGSGPTRDDLLRQNAAADTWQTVTVPGEVVLDADGIPTAMTPATTETVYVGGSTVTPAQLEAVGLTPDDVPNLSVIDPPKRRDQP